MDFIHSLKRDWYEDLLLTKFALSGIIISVNKE